MFRKVLVAEDMDSINQAVNAVLQDLDIKKAEHAQYCDQAWLLAKKALIDNEPFDLLICDLSFKKDHRDEKIKSGKELIKLLKEEDPDLKVIVHSIEDHPQAIKELWDSGNIDAYVCKDRNGLKYLREALKDISDGKTYNSPDIEENLSQSNLLLLNDFEINIIKHLANGKTQDEIQQTLKDCNIKPSSKSAIEKKLKELKEIFGANNAIHLVSIAKDLKII